MAQAAARRRRPVLLTSLILGTATLLGAGSAWATLAKNSATRSLSSRGHHLTSCKAASDEKVYLADVSPKGKLVIAKYKELLDVKDESKVADIMNELDSEQKQMLRGLIEARGGQEREVTTTKPEVGDTVQRLYKKYQMLEDDDAVVEWRKKLDQDMLESLQLVIEDAQKKLADENCAKTQDDEEAAEEAYASFVKQKPGAAEKEVFMRTPCRRNDIKYRFRRLKETMGISSEIANEIVAKDVTPMFVDPDFIRRTWKEMVKTVGYEEALNEIIRKHPGSLIVQPQNVKDKINEIKMGANVINAFDSLGKMFR
eukprot:TRINITY_DN30856_c0_g1_i1.p1 TRINITY_DN30856_c0_g1~~TRINITY_DN30856_c0_g1_i1.p1  ORF type:complete len:313 (+),score=87.03 TRINITY_DN30856_c0_g1_i1:72-1010(+)